MTFLLIAPCLFPLAVYCLILAVANRRTTPFLVPGPWDFAGVVFGASGFLVFGGAGVLAKLLLAMSLTNHLPPAVWVGALVLYFIILLGGPALLIWLNQERTSIYNIDVEVFPEILEHVLDMQKLTWHRSGDTIFIDRPDPLARGSMLESTAVLMRVTLSPLLCHVTLRWARENLPMRQEIEQNLARTLRGVHTVNNPLSGIFFAVGALLFTCIFGLLFLAVIFSRY